MHRDQGSREGSTMRRGGSRGGFQLVVECRDGGTQEVGCTGVGHERKIYVEVIYCKGENGKAGRRLPVRDSACRCRPDLGVERRRPYPPTPLHLYPYAVSPRLRKGVGKGDAPAGKGVR